MSDVIETILNFFKHFDVFFSWLRNALKIYTQPKVFIENLIALDAKERTKRIIGYFCFYESIILIISATLIDKIEFSLFKIPGLIFLDAIFALPLIFIILIALYAAGINSPVKKSITFVLVIKIFFGFPLQIFFFLFMFFENYVFYILFGGGIQLFALIILLLPPLFFANRNKQALILFGSTLGLLLLLIFVYSQIGKVNPKSENVEQKESFYDPIFSEYEKFRDKLKLIDEVDTKADIDQANNFSKLSEKDENDIDIKQLKEDRKYRNEFMLNRIKNEMDIFSKENICYFKTNKARFEVYRDFLNELSIYLEKTYSAYEIIERKDAIVKINTELDHLNNDLNNFKKYEYDENKKTDYSKYKTETELLKALEKEVENRRLAVEYEQLKINILKKESQVWENKTKIQDVLIGIMNEATRIEKARRRFSEDQMYYYLFILKIRSIIFI
jgi:hypothetical protein